MPKPYHQYVPPFVESGTVIKGMMVIAFSRREEARDRDGRLHSTMRYYTVECTNCKHKSEKTLNNVRNYSGCRNCSLLPKGQAGMNRMMQGYRRGAKSRHYEFSITAEEFRRLTSANCFYCGAKPSQFVACNRQRRKSTWGDYIANGIDRINNRKGYVDGNCVPCCIICNHAKSSLGFGEYLAHIRAVYQRIQDGEFPLGMRFYDA